MASLLSNPERDRATARRIARRAVEDPDGLFKDWTGLLLRSTVTAFFAGVLVVGLLWFGSAVL